jgi:hypothetical protein
MTYIDKIKKSLLNIPGWHTNRKIVVIESDDWGSIRMPSKDIYEKCLKAGYPVDLNPFERYDSLASEQDLNALFNVLSSFTDKNGTHPIITANCVVANPDFDKIKDDNFENYHFELITETFKKYPKHSNNFAIWLQAKNENLFFPQFHAREHLNVSKFMNALRQKDEDVMFGFKYGMPGSIKKGNENNGNSFVEATHFKNNIDKANKLSIYLNGLEIFEKLFEYKSESIIPPNYIWSEDFDEKVKDMGVKYIQGIRKFQQIDFYNKSNKSRFMGKRNSSGLIDLVRNVTFEPTLISVNNQVEQTLSDIELAFRMKKPAIISSHRINYVGFLDISNRDNTLFILEKTLQRLIKKWPTIEFMSSDQLGKIIENDKKYDSNS